MLNRRRPPPGSDDRWVVVVTHGTKLQQYACVPTMESAEANRRMATQRGYKSPEIMSQRDYFSIRDHRGVPPAGTGLPVNQSTGGRIRGR